jgi:hypothetical protein
MEGKIHPIRIRWSSLRGIGLVRPGPSLADVLGMHSFDGSSARYLFPFILTAAVACGGSDGSDTTGAEQDITASDGNVASGSYALETEIDLTKVAGAASKLDDALGPLSALGDSPATAILGDKLKDVLPDVLAGKVGDLFDAEALGGKLDIAALLAKVKAMLAKFKVLSTLDVADGQATHTLNGLSANFGDEHFDIPLTGLSETVPVNGRTIGAQQFALPLPGGLDKDSLIKKALTAALGKVIDCDKIATNVSKKCFATICVGHEPEIAGVCKKGLDGVVGISLIAMDKLKIDPLKLVTGNLDVPGGDVLGGLWKGSVDLGGGPLDIVSKFTGKKK